MYWLDIAFWQNHLLVSAFAIVVLVQLVYLLIFFSGLAFFKPRYPQTFTQPVSIIICAKNEAENLMRHLPEIFAQQYPQFEVVVVNDCSVDNTADVLKAFALQHTNLKVVHTPEQSKRPYFSKKLAVTLGIKAAAYEHLVFIDADCRPATTNWLQTITAPFAFEKIKMILGYSPYEKQKTLLNLLIGYDTWLIGLQYLSFAVRQLPYMGVGRNMAYAKELFFKHKGFASHMHLASGDDDLFVQQAANRHNTAIVPQPQAHTVSQPASSFSEWTFQKLRHLQTAGEYKPLHQLLLGGFSVSTTAFVILFPWLIITNPDVYLILGLAMAKYLIQFGIFNLVNKYLNDRRIVYLFWIIEPLLVVFYLYLFARKTTNKLIKWM